MPGGKGGRDDLNFCAKPGVQKTGLRIAARVQLPSLATFLDISTLHIKETAEKKDPWMVPHATLAAEAHEA